MKRKKLIQYIESCGCQFLREGANHTIYFNPNSAKQSAIPRHTEIHPFLARKICKDLLIPPC